MGKTIKSLLLPEKLSALVFNLAVLFFIIAFNFSDNPQQTGWYQQFMPGGLPNFQVSDIYFLDSLTGWAVTDNSNPNDSSGYILKTTNGGDNWILKFAEYRDFSRVTFLDASTGFVSGGYYNGARLYKTTNGGDNWSNIYNLAQIYLSDMNVLSEDTIWVTNPNSLEGGVFRTTNGGANWMRQASFGSNNPAHIYMYNARIGFIDAGSLRKTTDGGSSWTPIIGAGNFLDMYFIDSLTGWKCNLDMKKTTDGGLNWVTQTLPQGSNILISRIVKFDNIIKDTIWGVGSTGITGSGNRGLIYKSTNSGQTWGYQLPDSININIFQYQHVDFTTPLVGWAYTGLSGVHTVTGGDTTWYFGIQQTGTEVPEEFVLGQNYPNPFNPRTVIPFSLKKRARVRLIAYDIRGREVQTMVDSELSAGEYEVDFMGKFTSSGVYLYRLEVSDDRSKQLFTRTRKMILLK